MHQETLQYLFCFDPLNTGQQISFPALLHKDSCKYSEMNNVYGENYARWRDKYSLKTLLHVSGAKKKGTKIVNNINVSGLETLAQRRLIA